jgi:uncharacterized protein
VTTYLLDVNVLLALSDPRHVHHQIAHAWFAQTGKQSWATCPFTENGFVRIMSHPRYPNRPGDVPVVLEILRQFCAAPGHQFWTGEISIRDVLTPQAMVTHAHVTDIYLLGLAVHNAGKLATLDRRLPAMAVQGGQQAIEVISSR